MTKDGDKAVSNYKVENSKEYAGMSEAQKRGKLNEVKTNAMKESAKSMGKTDKQTDELMKDKNLAHQVLVKEELGINAEELKGSAMEAAISSFVLFGIGAVIPVLPFMFTEGMKAIILSTFFNSALYKEKQSYFLKFKNIERWFTLLKCKLEIK